MSPLTLVYQYFFTVVWLSWAAYWWLLSRRVKPTERSEPVFSRLLHVVPLIVAVALLWPARLRLPVLGARIFPWAPWQFWTAAAITMAGLLFSVWARVHLGRNWSGIVTVKHGHEFIGTGPYAIVRHPIYTGLIVALIGSALARGEWQGVLAVVLVVAALWRKLRLEERWMAERFGEQYAAYRRRVPALVPLWR